MGKLDKPDAIAAMQQATPREGAELIAGLPAVDAFNLMLEHDHPEQIVALLPPENLYLMVHEIGAEDALILLEMATPEQVQGFFDIDCWQRDRLVLPKARTWMLLVNEMGDDSFIANIKKLDFAMLVLFFRRHLKLYKLENPDDAVPMDGPTLLSPDGRHLIRYTCGTEQSKLVNTLLLRISKLDVDFYLYLQEAIYWETDAVAEETAYEDRHGRLESRGFPDYYDSLEIYTTVDPDNFAPPHKVVSKATDETAAKIAGSSYLVRFEHRESLLRRALADEFPGRDEATVEIMGLTNMVAVADNVSFIDLENVRGIVARTDGYLNIALQHLNGDDIVAARRTLTEIRAADLFRLGYSLIVRLAHRARGTIARATVDGKSADQLLLDGSERDLVYGLLQKHMTRLQDGEAQNWTELEQVRNAERQLTQIQALIDLMHDELGFTPDFAAHLFIARCNVADNAELTYRILFNTFFCHDWLGRKPAPTPLSREDLDTLADRLDDGAIPVERREQFRAWLDEKAGENADDVWLILERYLQGLAAELAHSDMPPQHRHQVLVKI